MGPTRSRIDSGVSVVLGNFRNGVALGMRFFVATWVADDRFWTIGAHGSCIRRGKPRVLHVAWVASRTDRTPTGR